MHAKYEDIKALTKQSPIWYDEHGTPRYCEFHPRYLANTDAKEAVLVSLVCQSCGNTVKAAVSIGTWQLIVEEGLELLDGLKCGTYAYGDFPWDDNCAEGCAGSSMTTDIQGRHVLEHWVLFDTEWVKKINIGSCLWF